MSDRESTVCKKIHTFGKSSAFSYEDKKVFNVFILMTGIIHHRMVMWGVLS